MVDIFVKISKHCTLNSTCSAVHFALICTFFSSLGKKIMTAWHCSFKKSSPGSVSIWQSTKTIWWGKLNPGFPAVCFWSSCCFRGYWRSIACHRKEEGENPAPSFATSIHCRKWLFSLNGLLLALAVAVTLWSHVQFDVHLPSVLCRALKIVDELRSQIPSLAIDIIYRLLVFG